MTATTQVAFDSMSWGEPEVDIAALVTAVELVRSRAPSLVVPFAEGGEDEQMNRARRLEHLHQRTTGMTTTREKDHGLAPVTKVSPPTRSPAFGSPVAT